MTEKVLLKDQLFNAKKVSQIANEIKKAYPDLQQEAFERDTLSKFPELELKARIHWIAQCLKRYLPVSYDKAVAILLRSLPPPCDPHRSDDDFGDFIYAAYNEFVAQNGCREEYLELSLKALKELTTRFSAEDAIRYFINAYPAQTLKALDEWSRDTHYHVRRLCSEGTRPKLPWSAKIRISVQQPMGILHRLHADKTRFVTRSVANHLNDISKSHPDLAISALDKWKKAKQQSPEEVAFMVRHALRTLIKKGHPKALRLLGVSHRSKVELRRLSSPKKVKLGSALEFSFELRAPQKTAVIVDYVLTFCNKSGQAGGKKVFKLKTLMLEKNEPALLTKRHKMLRHMTTRTLYPGRHELAIQVNGRVCAKASFDLIS